MIRSRNKAQKWSVFWSGGYCLSKNVIFTSQTCVKTPYLTEKLNKLGCVSEKAYPWPTINLDQLRNAALVENITFRCVRSQTN